MVGSDHFHQLWLDNMPQFLVGKAPFYDANWYNEEREFGLPRMTLAGEEDLSQHILRNGLDAGFDLAFSNELRIDHSITCPIITLRPEPDLPIVPIYTNIFAPPLPQPKRFVELGRTIRQLVESWPDDQRVAIIGTGHLSLELGGPRQFGPHGPDPEFDRKAVEWIASGDLEGCLAEVTLDSLHLPGNATHGFMDFMLMMGVAGDGDGRGPRRLARPVPHDGGLLHLVPRRRRPSHEQVPARQVPLHRRPRPALVERYRDDPAGTVTWWEAEEANRILNCTTDEQSTWLAFTDEERDVLVRQDHVRLFEMGAHPFLTLTLFIAMFERDHGPLEYQIAYGKAMEHLVAPLPRHRDLRAAVLTAHGEPPTYAEHPDPTAAEGQVLVRVTAAPVVPLDLLCASGTSYFGAPALPYVPGVQGVGVDATRGRRVWFSSSAGMKPGDGSLGEWCASPRPTWCRSRTGVDDTVAAAFGLSGVAAWMALTWRARAAGRASGCWCSAPAAPSARPPSGSPAPQGAGRVVAVCRAGRRRPGPPQRGPRRGHAAGVRRRRRAGRRADRGAGRTGRRGGRPGVRLGGRGGLPGAGAARSAGQPRRLRG